MRELVLTLHHDDCWCTRATEKLPGVKMELASNPIKHSEGPKGGVVSAIWQFTGGDEEIDKAIGLVKKMGDCVKLEVLHRTGERALVSVTSKYKDLTMDRIVENMCYVVKPLTVSGGLEHWTLVTGDSAKKLIDDLGGIGEVKVQKVGRFEPEENRNNLTAKQEQALKLAIQRGYYEWPKKVTLEELAGMSGITRVTFQNHLRKAEEKAIPRLEDY